MTALKTINYRGGIARFRLPSTWVEEYEPAGGGAFYEDGPDTGTLRINVMGFQKPTDSIHAAGTAFDFLAAMESNSNVVSLPGNAAIARSIRPAVENGEGLLVYTWKVGLWVAPDHFRLVVFTYTILAGKERESAMQEEIALLDKSIVEGEYPAVKGVVA